MSSIDTLYDVFERVSAVLGRKRQLGGDAQKAGEAHLVDAV